MKPMVDGHNLFDHPASYYEQMKREADIALKSRQLLTQIKQAVSMAGGGFDEKGLAEMPLAQFLVLMTRNSIELKVSCKAGAYTQPANPDDLDVPF